MNKAQKQLQFYHSLHATLILTARRYAVAMFRELKGKYALVTGAGGVGRAISAALAQEGCQYRR